MHVLRLNINISMGALLEELRLCSYPPRICALGILLAVGGGLFFFPYGRTLMMQPSFQQKGASLAPCSKDEKQV